MDLYLLQHPVRYQTDTQFLVTWSKTSDEKSSLLLRLQDQGCSVSMPIVMPSGPPIMITAPPERLLGKACTGYICPGFQLTIQPLDQCLIIDNISPS
jgi:hypothetical protein